MHEILALCYIHNSTPDFCCAVGGTARKFLSDTIKKRTLAWWVAYSVMGSPDSQPEPCPDIRTKDTRTLVYKDTYLAFNKGQNTEGQMTKKQMNIYYPTMNYITIFM